MDSNSYNLIWEILDLLLSFENKNIINIINGYNDGYKYISNYNYEEINIYKLTIESFINNL